MKFGYIRVSTLEQNIDRQEEQIKNYGVDKIFIDKQSGKDIHRPQLQEMLRNLRKDDEVIVLSLDRLGRSTKDLLYIIDTIEQTGAKFHSLKENIDTSTSMGRFFLTVLSALAELERSNILERQRQGIAIARKQGKYKGRKKKEVLDFENIYKQWSNGSVTAEQAAKLLGISKATFYRRKKEYEDTL